MNPHPTSASWTPEQDEKLRQLHAQGFFPLAHAAGMKRTVAAVQLRARKIALAFPGVRETKRKIRAAEPKRNKYDMSPKW